MINMMQRQWRDRRPAGGSWAYSELLLFDVLVAGFSLVLAVQLRVGTEISPDLMDALLIAVPLFMGIAAVSFRLGGVYVNLLRYASINDIVAIVRSVTFAVVAFVVIMFLITRLDAIPRSTPIIQWFILVMLVSSTRVLVRLRHRRRAPRTAGLEERRVPILLVGAGDAADLFVRAIERDPHAPYSVVGILDDSDHHQGYSLHRVPVLGGCADLVGVVARLTQAGRRPQHLIVTEPAAKLGGAVVRQLVREGEALGLVVSRPPAPTELRRPDAGVVELRPIEITDLLGRPQANLDRTSISRLVAGRRVLVTGAGGTIGGELTKQLAALRPALLVLVDAGEYNLYSIDLALKEQFPEIPRIPLLADVRDRARVMQIFEEHRPELVFHAAALKHVPMVELNPCEGVLTNLMGSRNVADAAARYQVRAMVQVSSDKAVNPTNVMGATKRLAELYCQALDLRSSADPEAPRFMTVRFGNVLGSSGSLIPLFEHQLARGGPLTVTHPDICRYFMTVREAVELVLQASAHGVEKRGGVGEIFVLDMGEPVRIVDIAERMIRLAGLRPGIDVQIEFVGLRPGEKLYEELFDSNEARLPAKLPGILGARLQPAELEWFARRCDELAAAAAMGEAPTVRAIMLELLPGYQPEPAPVAPARVRPVDEAPAVRLVRAAEPILGGA